MSTAAMMNQNQEEINSNSSPENSTILYYGTLHQQNGAALLTFPTKCNITHIRILPPGELGPSSPNSSMNTPPSETAPESFNVEIVLNTGPPAANLSANMPLVVTDSIAFDASKGATIYNTKLPSDLVCKSALFRGNFDAITLAAFGTTFPFDPCGSLEQCTLAFSLTNPSLNKMSQKVTRALSQHLTLQKQGLYNIPSTFDPFTDISFKFARKCGLSQAVVVEYIQDAFQVSHTTTDPSFNNDDDNGSSSDQVSPASSSSSRKSRKLDKDSDIHSYDKVSFLFELMQWSPKQWSSLDQDQMKDLVKKVDQNWKSRLGQMTWYSCEAGLKILAKAFSCEQKTRKSFLELSMLKDISKFIENNNLLPRTLRKIFDYLVGFTTCPEFISHIKSTSLFDQFIQQSLDDPLIASLPKETYQWHIKTFEDCQSFWETAIDIVNTEAPADNVKDKTASPLWKKNSKAIDLLNQITRCHLSPFVLVQFFIHHNFFEALTIFLCSSIETVQQDPTFRQQIFKKVANIILLLLSSDIGAKYVITELSILCELEAKKKASRHFIWSEVTLFEDSPSLSTSSHHSPDHYIYLLSMAVLRRGSEWNDYSTLTNSTFISNLSFIRFLTCCICVSSLFSVVRSEFPAWSKSKSKSIPLLNALKMLQHIVEYDSARQIVLSFLSHKSILPSVVQIAISDEHHQQEITNICRHLLADLLEVPAIALRNSVQSLRKEITVFIQNHELGISLRYLEEYWHEKDEHHFSLPSSIPFPTLAKKLTKCAHMIESSKYLPLSSSELRQVIACFELIIPRSNTPQDRAEFIFAFNQHNSKSNPILQRSIIVTTCSLLDSLIQMLLSHCACTNTKIMNINDSDILTTVDVMDLKQLSKQESLDQILHLIRSRTRVNQPLQNLLDAILLVIIFNCQFLVQLTATQQKSNVLSKTPTTKSENIPKPLSILIKSLVEALMSLEKISKVRHSNLQASYVFKLSETHVSKLLTTICQNYKSSLHVSDTLKAILHTAVDDPLGWINSRVTDYLLCQLLKSISTKHQALQFVESTPLFSQYLLSSGPQGKNSQSLQLRKELIMQIHHVENEYDVSLLESILQVLLFQLVNLIDKIVIHDENRSIDVVHQDTPPSSIFDLGKDVVPYIEKITESVSIIIDSSTTSIAQLVNDDLSRPTLSLFSSALDRLSKHRTLRPEIYALLETILRPFTQLLLTKLKEKIVQESDINIIKTNFYAFMTATDNKLCDEPDKIFNQDSVLDFESVSKLIFPLVPNPVSIYDAPENTEDGHGSTSLWSFSATDGHLDELSPTVPAPLSKVYSGNDFRNASGLVHTTPLSKPGKQRLPSRHVDAFEGSGNMSTDT